MPVAAAKELDGELDARARHQFGHLIERDSRGFHLLLQAGAKLETDLKEKVTKEGQMVSLSHRWVVGLRLGRRGHRR